MCDYLSLLGTALQSVQAVCLLLSALRQACVALSQSSLALSQRRRTKHGRGTRRTTGG